MARKHDLESSCQMSNETKPVCSVLSQWDKQRRQQGPCYACWSKVHQTSAQRCFYCWADSVKKKAGGLQECCQEERLEHITQQQASTLSLCIDLFSGELPAHHLLNRCTKTLWSQSLLKDDSSFVLFIPRIYHYFISLSFSFFKI